MHSIQHHGYPLLSTDSAFNCRVTNHWSDGQLPDVIEEFVLMIEAMGYRIRRLKTDAFVNSRLAKFLKAHGIVREPSAPHTQAQNGAAESAGCYLTRIACSIRIHAKLPANLWSECVKTAAYLLNLWPTERLDWITPFEAVTGRQPSLAHLEVFGCRAYPLDHTIPKLQKLDSRAHIGYLVGYDSSKIFRIWIPFKGKVVRTRDVTFDPTRFYHPDDADIGLVQDVAQLIGILPPLPTLSDGTLERGMWYDVSLFV